MTKNIIDTFQDIESAAQSGAFGINPLAIPTDGQCRAGNYKVGRVNVYGLNISIEQPRHSYRTGIDKKTGKRWTNRLAAHYGYFSGTKGNDGDPVDCFIGFYPQSERVYVINQYINGQWDEHKVMLCFPDEETAKRAYLDSYDKGWNGLHSLTKSSISQFKWWLKNGNMKKPLAPNHLPYDGYETMNKRIYWDSATALPEAMTLDQLLYQIRRADSGENLLLDSVSIDDILEEVDGILAFDALVTPYAALERKMTALKAVMERSGGTVKPVALQVTDPFKQSGVAQVAAVFELSDGQTVAIYFHNPDVDPRKIQQSDELISWKWLLNKKDITIVVAPERGDDLKVRDVAIRIMKLAEKNSQAFQRANTKRAENMQAIQSINDEIVVLEKELIDAQHELEVAKIELEDRANITPKSFDDYVNDADGDTYTAAKKYFKTELQGKIIKTVAGDVHIIGSSFTEMKRGTKKDEIKAKLFAFVEPILKNGVYKGKEDLNKERNDSFIAFHFFELDGIEIGDYTVDAGVTVAQRRSGELEFDLSAYGLGHSNEARWQKRIEANPLPRSRAEDELAPQEPPKPALDATIYQDSETINIVILKVYDKDGSELKELEDIDQQENSINPIIPEDYAKIMTDPALQEQYQDTLDAFFQARVLDVRNALRELGWEGRQPEDARLYKGEAEAQFTFMHVGAGANVTGYVVNETQDDLTKTPEQLAAEIDAAAMLEVNKPIPAVPQGEGDNAGTMTEDEYLNREDHLGAYAKWLEKFKIEHQFQKAIDVEDGNEYDPDKDPLESFTGTAFLVDQSVKEYGGTVQWGNFDATAYNGSVFDSVINPGGIVGQIADKDGNVVARVRIEENGVLTVFSGANGIDKVSEPTAVVAKINSAIDTVFGGDENKLKEPNLGTEAAVSNIDPVLAAIAKSDEFGRQKEGFIGSAEGDLEETLTRPESNYPLWGFSISSDGYIQAQFALGNGQYTGGDRVTTPEDAYTSMISRHAWKVLSGEEVPSVNNEVQSIEEGKNDEPETVNEPVPVPGNSDLVDPPAVEEKEEQVPAKPVTELDKQRHKLKQLAELQERMKAANKVVNNKKLSDEQKVEQLMAQNFPEHQSRELLKPDFAGRTGFASYQLTNNNAVIRSTQKRIADLEARELAESKATSGDRPTSYGFDGGTVDLAYSDDRIRINFDSKPDSTMIAKLKSNGFKWSPSNTAWQRQLTDNAIATTNYLLGTEIQTAASIMNQAQNEPRPNPIVPPPANPTETNEVETTMQPRTEKPEVSEAPDGQENVMQAAFAAELESLKLETSIEAFDKRLDEIADRIEQAGLMAEMDSQLNEAADKLTELMAEAEKMVA